MPTRGEAGASSGASRIVTTLGSTRFRLMAPSDIAFSPDGQCIAAAGSGWMRVFAIANGAIVNQLCLRGAGASSVAYQSDGSRLAVGCWDGTIRVLDLTRGATRMLRPKRGAGHWVRFIPNQPILISTNAESHDISVWNVETGRLLQWVQGRDLGESVITGVPESGRLAINNSGRWAAFVGRGFGLWAIGDDAQLRRVRYDSLAGGDAIAFQPNGDGIALGNDEGRIALCRIGSDHPDRVLGAHDGDVNALAFSADGSVLYSASSDHTIRGWHVESGRKVHELRARGGHFFSLSVSRDGTRLASGGPETLINVWNLPFTGGSPEFPIDEDYLVGPRFAPDGSQVVSGTWSQGVVSIWDSRTGRRLRTIPHEGVNVKSAFSCDGTAVATGQNDGRVAIWSAHNGSMLRSWNIVSSPVEELACSPTTPIAVTGHQCGQVLIWDWHDSTARVLGSLDEAVCSVAFSPDGRTVAVGSTCAVSLWDALSKRKLCEIQDSAIPAIAVRFAGTDKVGIVSSGGVDVALQLWSVRTPRRARLLIDRRPTSERSIFSSLAFTRSGNVAAYAIGPEGSGRSAIHIVRVKDWRRLLTLRGHLQAVTSLEFSANGNWLLSGSEDSTAIIWDVADVASGKSI